MKINREPRWMTKTNQALKITAVAGGIAIGLHLFLGRPAKAIEPQSDRMEFVRTNPCKIDRSGLNCN